MSARVARVIGIGIVMAGVFPAAVVAAGQAPESPPAAPRLEIVAGGGLSGHRCCGGVPSAGVLVTFNLTPRLSVEAGSDMSGTSNTFRGTYLILGKFRFRHAPGPSWFMTFGTAGFFDRYDVPQRLYTQPDGSTVVYPAYTDGYLQRPALGVAGVGYFYPVAGRLGLRGEGDLMAGGVRGFGVWIRAMGAVVVPIGRYRR